MPFYAISAPCVQNDGAMNINSGDINAEERVFKTTEDALKALKTNKQSRLKTFEHYQDALKFASEPFNITNERGDENKPIPNNTAESSTPTPSEGCPFKSLTPQQLKGLKQAIADEDISAFEELVAENPRYLTTPCDTPSILHSGTRANALHVAANEGGTLWGKSSPKMTEKVLDTIHNPNLMERMYPQESAEARARRQEYLFDMYLNTPLKGSNDTPLHIATKYGALDVVALLVQFSSCDTKRLNKDGLTPAEIAGSRMAKKDTEVIKKILQLLSDNVYIPVYRVCDHSQPAYIGELWSPRRPTSMLSSAQRCQKDRNPKEGDEDWNYDDNVANNNDNCSISATIDLESLSPIMIRHQLQGIKSSLTAPESNFQHTENEPEALQTSFTSPAPNNKIHSTTSNKKRKSPLLISTKKYSTSPLVTPNKNLMGPPSKQSPIMQNLTGNLFDSSGYNSSTSSCRSMSSPMSVQAILGPFSNLEEAKKIQQEWRKPQTKSSNYIRLKDPVKGLEKEGRNLAKKYNSSMIEYWSFLETYCDLTTDHGLNQLDNYLHEKTECNVCMTPKFDITCGETSFQDDNRAMKQRAIEQDKMAQLQDILADLHITPNVQESFDESGDNSSEENSVDRKDNLSIDMPYDNANADDTYSYSYRKQLELSILNENDTADIDDFLKGRKQSTDKNEHLSPTSIWSRTRETKLNLTGSSNESECNPFRFEEELENIDIPSSVGISIGHRTNEYSTGSEGSSFHSVASSLQSSILTAEEGSNWVYLLGNIPTETDRQVYEILKHLNVKQYPSINAWKILIETFSEQEREQWQPYEKQIKNVNSDLLISKSNIVNEVKSKLLFEDD